MRTAVAVRQLVRVLQGVGNRTEKVGAYSTATGAANVFDRRTKCHQRNRAAMAANADTYDYLKDRVAETVMDRVADIARFFPKALDMGCGRGHIAKTTTGDLVGTLVQTDMAHAALQSGCGTGDDVVSEKILADEEDGLPFADNTFNLVVSSLSLHWVNNLPGVMREVHRVLCPDAPFIGVMFAGDTLFELRSALQLAEMERCSGLSPHISPFVDVRDMGGLLGQAGYSLTTIDTDELTVHYPSMFELMKDLQGMGESNCAWRRPLLLRRDVMLAAATIYQEMYGGHGQEAGSGHGQGEAPEGIPATFQLLYFIGWKPHPSQAKPLARGSATASFKDLTSLSQTQDKST